MCGRDTARRRAAYVRRAFDAVQTLRLRAPQDYATLKKVIFNELGQNGRDVVPIDDDLYILKWQR